MVCQRHSASMSQTNRDIYLFSWDTITTQIYLHNPNSSHKWPDRGPVSEECMYVTKPPELKNPRWLHNYALNVGSVSYTAPACGNILHDGAARRETQSNTPAGSQSGAAVSQAARSPCPAVPLGSVIEQEPFKLSLPVS